MKQQVNLLPLVLQKEGILNSRLLVSLWAALIVVIVLISGYEFYELMGLKRSLAALNIKKLDTNQRLEKLAASLPGKDETEFLISEIARLETEVKTKKRVISQLSGRAIGNTVGFSPYLEGFARQIRNGIWIKKIEISNGGADLDIYGTTLSAALVPRLLKDLSNEQIFSDTEFKSFIMNREQVEDEQISRKIDFTIQTALPDKENNRSGQKNPIDRAKAVLKALTVPEPAPQSETKEEGK